MSRVVYGMLVASGRITMLGLSRWTEKGGSYRTIQRFYHSVLPWNAMHWMFFRKRFLRPEDEYITAGDEVVVSKAGKERHGLDQFFSGIQQRVIPSLSFFALSLVNVREERSYPMQIVQVVKSPEEKAASKAKAEVRKTAEKKKRGRPQGSKNKTKKEEVVLNAELLRIQKALKSLLETIGTSINLKYVALDGHFGNYPSACMVKQANLDLISKMRSDAALYLPFEGEYGGVGRPAKYGEKIHVRQLDPKYLKETSTEDHLRTDIYQGQFYNKEFAFPLNVVIILKTNLNTGAQAHVILFSTDLELTYDQIIRFYSLRFRLKVAVTSQIEFNFRDAKQYWGLEDFTSSRCPYGMNVKEIAVTNAANLSFFMVNLSYALLQPFRSHNPEYSILDLKSHYRGCRYAFETIKMLPQKPDAILLADIFQQIARLGAIHSAFQPSAIP